MAAQKRPRKEPAGKDDGGSEPKARRLDAKLPLASAHLQLVELFDAVDRVCCFLMRQNLPCKVSSVTSLLAKLCSKKWGGEGELCLSLQRIAGVSPDALELRFAAPPAGANEVAAAQRDNPASDSSTAGMGMANTNARIAAAATAGFDLVVAFPAAPGSGNGHIKRRAVLVRQGLLRHINSHHAAFLETGPALPEPPAEGGENGGRAEEDEQSEGEDLHASKKGNKKRKRKRAVVVKYPSKGRWHPAFDVEAVPLPEPLALPELPEQLPPLPEAQEVESDTDAWNPLDAAARRGKSLTGDAVPESPSPPVMPDKNSVPAAAAEAEPGLAAPAVAPESEALADMAAGSANLTKPVAAKPLLAASFDAHAVLQHLQSLPLYRGQIVHVEALPARPAHHAEPAMPLPPPVHAALAQSKGVTRLFKHQVKAIDAALAGLHVAISTSTSSGKSVAFNVPVIVEALARGSGGGGGSGNANLGGSNDCRGGGGSNDCRSGGGSNNCRGGGGSSNGYGGRGCSSSDVCGGSGGSSKSSRRNSNMRWGTPAAARAVASIPSFASSVVALYMFPTKALAQDQLRSVREFVEADPALVSAVRCAVLDGDSSQAERSAAALDANVVLTNPDMLHASVLPAHKRYKRFFQGLRYVVIDEAHVYKGVFGSQVSHVLRRLLRLCALYAPDLPPPQFICCSATMRDPRRHFAALVPLVAEASAATKGIGDLCSNASSGNGSEEGHGGGGVDGGCGGGGGGGGGGGAEEDSLCVVTEDSAPRGEKLFVLWNPPKIHKRLLFAGGRARATDGANGDASRSSHTSSASGKGGSNGSTIQQQQQQQLLLLPGDPAEAENGEEEGGGRCGTAGKEADGVAASLPEAATPELPSVLRSEPPARGRRAADARIRLRGAEVSAAVAAAASAVGSSAVGASAAASLEDPIGEADGREPQPEPQPLGCRLGEAEWRELELWAGLAPSGDYNFSAGDQQRAGDQQSGGFSGRGGSGGSTTSGICGGSGNAFGDAKGSGLIGSANGGEGEAKGEAVAAANAAVAADGGSNGSRVACGENGSWGSRGGSSGSDIIGSGATGGEEPEDWRRRSPIVEMALLFTALVKRRARTLAFCRTRKLTELVLRYANQDLGASAPQLLPLVRGYRGGYTKEARRDIEKELFADRLLGVTATSALELGIDIGSLDVTLHLGFPGSVSSLWQQAGRAGRGAKPSLAIMVLFEDPVSQFFARSPAELLTAPPEEAALDPFNENALQAHITCAAAEIPLELPGVGAPHRVTTETGRAGSGGKGKSRASEASESSESSEEEMPMAAAAALWGGDAGLFGGVERFSAAVELLARGEAPALLPEPVSRLWVANPAGVATAAASSSGARGPAAAVSLRMIDPVSFEVICGATTDGAVGSWGGGQGGSNGRSGGRVLDTIEYHRAFFELFQGAIYLHQARQYQVVRLDCRRYEAHVRAVRVNYHTSSRNETSIKITKKLEECPGGLVHTGCCDVVDRIYGYAKIHLGTGRVLEHGECDLQPLEYATRCFWIDPPSAALMAVAAAGLDLDSGIHAAAHALLAVVPLFLMCDAGDVSVVHVREHRRHPAPKKIIIFDRRPGGVGVAEALFRRRREVLVRALRLVGGCNCRAGCLACIHTHACTGYNARLDKAAAIVLLQGVLRVMQEGLLPIIRPVITDIAVAAAAGSENTCNMAKHSEKNDGRGTLSAKEGGADAADVARSMPEGRDITPRKRRRQLNLLVAKGMPEARQRDWWVREPWMSSSTR